MPDSGDLNRVVAFQIEENSVIAATQAESGYRRLQFLCFTCTTGEEAIHTVKYLQGYFAVDCAKITARFGRPLDRDAFGIG